MTHLLVTNDFPPKIGGIQTYLHELWRRLDPADYAVLTRATGPGDAAFDAAEKAAGARIERLAVPVLVPGPSLRHRIRSLAEELGAGLVVLDPALPLGLLGPRLGLPYAVVLHGAEVTVPARLPVTAALLRRVLAGAALLVAAGRYPAEEVARLLGGRRPPVVVVPPGVDAGRIVPLGPGEREAARRRFGVPPRAPLVTSVSRLVPRKGMDRLVSAAAALRPSFPDLAVLVAGEGRDAKRLARLVDAEWAPVRLLGGLGEAEKAQLLGASDVFAMACRTRWGGLEQEGFGIVFLEAAAAGVVQVAGRSGGAAEAVVDGATGLVVADPADPGALAGALRRLLADPDRCQAMGQAARRRVEESFDYGVLAPRLAAALAEVGG